MESENTHGGDTIRTKLVINNGIEDCWDIKMESTKTQGQTSFAINAKTLNLEKSEAVKPESETIEYKMQLTRADMIVMGELCKFALPYLLGWDILDENKVVQLPLDIAKY